MYWLREMGGGRIGPLAALGMVLVDERDSATSMGSKRLYGVVFDAVGVEVLVGCEGGIFGSGWRDVCSRDG